MFNKNKKEKVLTEEEIKRNSGLCQYRSKCTDFEKKCYKCEFNGLNQRKSYFKELK